MEIVDQVHGGLHSGENDLVIIEHETMDIAIGYPAIIARGDNYPVIHQGNQVAAIDSSVICSSGMMNGASPMWALKICVPSLFGNRMKMV